jgi:hypothetical protein
MNREVKQPQYRLWLLALVLALALTWYTLHPVPGALQSSQREDTPPDAKRRQTRTPHPGVGLQGSKGQACLPAIDQERPFEDFTDWPEYLDLDEGAGKQA